MSGGFFKLLRQHECGVSSVQVVFIVWRVCAQLGRYGILLAICRRKYQHDRDWPDRFHSQRFEHCDRHQVYALWHVLETPETFFSHLGKHIRLSERCHVASLQDAVYKVFVPFTSDFEFYHGRSPIAVESTIRIPPKQTDSCIHQKTASFLDRQYNRPAFDP